MLCIPKFEMEKLKKAFREGEISIEKLYEMTDIERNTLFKHYLGEDFAKVVNTNFEKAMLSTQKDAFNKFVEKTFTTKQVDLRTAMIKKLEKIDKVMNQTEVEDFLGDLANTKLGMKDVSEAEIQTMLEKKKTFEELETKILKDTKRGTSPEEMAYGYALDDFNTYVGKLKERTTPLTAKEIAVQKLTNPGEIYYDIASTTKSALSTFDNSLWGRQGIKLLFTPFTGGTKIWARNFIKSWKDLGRTIISKSKTKGLKGAFSELEDPVMRSIRANVYARKNFRNGKYAAAKNGYGLNVKFEEAFPSTLIERIPGIGRLFKGADVMFSGGALRMRADLADSLIKRAEKFGVDTLNKEEAIGMGELVGQMTGRGEIGKWEVGAKQINATFFSIKFLKSNFDTLLSPVKLGISYLQGEKAGRFAKKQAALNLAQIIGSIATIGIIANKLHPGSFESNPSSTNFGKIKINGHYFDITGGMGSIVVLASRIITGTSISSTGGVTKLYEGKFGASTALDLVENFFEGKLAPVAGTIRDLLKGQNFQGEKPTPTSITKGLITPISIQTFSQLEDPSFADALLVIIGDGLGFGSSTPKIKKSTGFKIVKPKIPKVVLPKIKTQ